MTSATGIAEQINALSWVKIGRWIQAPLFAWSNITGRTCEFNQATLGFDYEFRHFLFLDWEYQFEESEFEVMKRFFNEKLAANKVWFRDYERIVSKVSNDMIDFSKPYLSYPDFDRDPHPALSRSVKLSLRTLDLDCYEYGDLESPPILHRKECFLLPDHPLYERFSRLTAQEERQGLLEDSRAIGTRAKWKLRLEESGFELKGHRLVRTGG